MGTAAGNVVQFPGTKQKSCLDQSHKIINIDGIKYYAVQQIRLLRRTVRDQAALGIDRSRLTTVREWTAIDMPPLALS
jgi:hypothetical protein